MKWDTLLQKRMVYSVNLMLLLLASAACNLSGASPTPPENEGQPLETVVTVTALPVLIEASPTPDAVTDPGTERSKPAAQTETVATRNWEFSIVEVLRGDEAMKMLKQASSLNGPPKDEEMEYILVKVHVRSVAADSEKQSIDRSFFQSTGSANVVYKRPSIVDVKTPNPILQAELLPGDESEGWITVLATKGDTAPVLIIQPRVNGLLSAEEEWRYISLEP